MDEYVSDSDQEAHILSGSHVRQRNIADSLADFGSQRQDALTYLRQREMLPSAGSDDEDAASEEEEVANLHLVQAYLKEQETHRSARRSLRKRNFSSTHPYLADQAHWLGLISVDSLNRIYSETQDIDSILKLLNSMYLKKRKRYLKDEKYKPKSFYTFLGRNMPPQESQEEAFESSQLSVDQAASQTIPPKEQSDLSDMSFSDLDDELIMVHRKRKENNNLMGPELDDQMSSDEAIEVDIIAPLSRNSSSRKKPRVNATSRSKVGLSIVNTPRKGLAVKKRKRSMKRALSVQPQIRWDNFIDDKEYYQDESTYPKLISTNRNLGDSGIANDISDEEHLTSETDIFSDDNDVVGYYNDKMNYSPISFLENGSFNEMSRDPFPVYGAKQSTKNVSKLPPTYQSVDSKRLKGQHDAAQARLNVQSSRLRNVLREKRPSSQNTERCGKKQTKGGVEKRIISSDVHKNKSGKTHYTARIREATKDMSTRRTAFTPPLNQFQRTPNQSTIVFEATKIAHEQSYAHEIVKQRMGSMLGTPQFTSCDDLLLSRMEKSDIKKLGELNSEFHVFSKKDTLSLLLYGEPFKFSIFDITGSNRNFLGVMLKLKQLLVIEKCRNLNKNNIAEMNKAIQVLIEWSLIQQKHNSLIYVSVSNLLLELSKVHLLDLLLLQITSQLIVLELIMTKIYQRSEPPEVQNFHQAVELHCVHFFKSCFLQVDFSDMLKMDCSNFVTHIFNSLFIFFHYHPDQWWNYITSALRMCHLADEESENVLNGLLWVSVNFPTKTNWKAILSFHELFCRKSIHLEQSHKLLSVIWELEQRLSWPIEEKVVLELYSLIAQRKFADYEDEENSEFILGRIRTRNDIPSSTYFERYMLFIYSYVSSLSFGSNKKRLITKLLMSSQFQYLSSSAHRAMFVNRMNFMLLLSQLSDINLEAQIFDLICQIKDTGDYKYYKIIAKVINSMAETSAGRPQCFPFICLPYVIELISEKFHTNPELLHLWPSLRSLLMFSLRLESTEKHILAFISKISHVNLCQASTDISLDVTRLLLHFYESSPLIRERKDIVDSIESNNMRLLNHHMGKYPLKNPHSERRTDELVEVLLDLWITVFIGEKDRTWDILVLQKYPYLGNQDLRERFLLYFYDSLLKSKAKPGSYDSIVRAVMKELAAFSSSRYFVDLFNLLVRQRVPIFDIKNQCGLDFITSLQLLNFRSTIATCVIQNVVVSNSVAPLLKNNYIETFTETLSDDLGLFFLSQKYVTFCKKVIYQIQSIYPSPLIQSHKFKSVCIRLGISPPKGTSHWTGLNFTQRLKVVNSGLLTALNNNSDHVHELDSYVSTYSMDIIYHLTMIYFQELKNHNIEKWPIFCHLLHYIWIKLKSSRIDVADPNFLKFVSILGTVIKICRERKNTTEINDSNHKVEIMLEKVLEYSRRVYDGFREQGTIDDVIYGCLHENCSSSELDTINSSLSNIRLYDLQTPELASISVHTDGLQIDEMTPIESSIIENNDLTLDPLALCIDFDL